MAVRVLWSREEAIILLDALIQTRDGKIDRSSAILDVSKKLRKLAQDKGLDIDDVYRNVNGITLQMKAMEYYFTDGKQGLNKPAKLFQEVVELYKNDRNEYEKLLREVKGVTTENNVADQFAQWLSERVSPRQLSELYMAYADVEAFCLARKILKKKLFETTDRKTIKAVVDTVNSNRVFRFNYRKNLGRTNSAMKYYYDFIKELDELKEVRRPESVAVKDPVIEKTTNPEEHGAAESAAEFTVDFTSSQRLPFTKPYSVAYFDDEVAVSNWTQVYIQTVAFLLEDYPDVLEGLINHNIYGQGRNDFADEARAAQMAAPKKVADNFYLETNLSATDIVAKIRRILDICNVDYENLVIKYTKRDAVQPEPILQPAVPGQPIESKKETTTVGTPLVEREKFSAWMTNNGSASGTIASYLSAINQCAKALKEYDITQDELLTITDTDTLVRYRDALLIKSDFRKLNEQQHNRFRAAFNKLIDFRSSGDPIDLSRSMKPAPRPVREPVQQEIPKIAIPDFTGSATSATDPEMERFDAILKENFSEGLLPNALRLDKFRMLYEDEYGTEPTQDDDLLVAKLKKVGSFIDGRIYPKQDTEQNNLIADILTEIIITLNGGARCVFISCVMERWQQELANQLNVYNEDTLRALLASQKVPGLYITDTVLKATVQKVYPEENVVELMKESHLGMNYQQLQEKLWYISMDTIKLALVRTPQMVNVDAETYFYAPNFPASHVELQHLKQCMEREIADRGYLAAPDVARIIRDDCKTIAINTAEYKDWAYRNILRYIFRDDFEFGSSVITEKGKALEMWQVFRGYCRDHERITLDDLRALKDELGVTIYWDTVMSEMVRINKDELIRRDLVHFDIEATDKVLDEMCPGDYISLKNIRLFLHFPPIEHPWNEFVLESYLKESKAFKLYHASFANHGAFGVIVRSSSRFADYQSVVVDMLAHSNEWSTTKDALELIVDKGYQARKRWTNFEQVTQEAGLLREKLEQERM